MPGLPEAAHPARRAAWIIGALIVLRLVCAAITPLAFDEAYYWTWSKSLAAGYYDHAPLVAWIIRGGTLIGGDTELGVRLLSILLAVPMSYAVYRAAAILCGTEQAGADAAIFLNATLMAAGGTLIVTPDAPLMVASSFVLLCLAKIVETGRGAWWLAAGAAVGVALLSKYTALFFGPAILLWLVVSSAQRRWLATPWPYLGGLVALLLFMPVVIWNAGHGWVSFIKQFDRVQVNDLTLRYVAELIPAQLGLATPFVFVLGVMGLYLTAVRRSAAGTSQALINAMVWVIVAYFVWHALHAHVEANWFSIVYPAFAVAAALAAHHGAWPPRARWLVERCRRWALPLGAGLFAVLVIHVNTGILTLNRRDGSVRAIGVGWPQLAAQIETVRQGSGADCVVAANYPITSWLAFYLPRGNCVFSISERIRWPGEPDSARLRDRLIYVAPASGDGVSDLVGHPGYLRTLGNFERRRGKLVIERIRVDLIDGAQGEILDRSPPPELVSW